MKHDLRVTILLVLFFLAAQVIGLTLVNLSIKGVNIESGVPVLVHDETILGPRPEFTGLGAFSYVIAGVAIGTLLVLLIIRLGKVNLWKAWFFLAVLFAISLALDVVLEDNLLVFVLAIGLAVLKIYRPSIIVHNVTELLMYSGIAVMIVPLFQSEVFWVIALLLVISLYDFIAVFKSKHMVKMAKFQADSKVFAGLFIPYRPKDAVKPLPRIKIAAQKSPSIPKPEDTKSAVLGGGDIAFPMIFSGVVMEHMIMSGYTRAAAMGSGLIITVCVTIALASLFMFAQKDKFYPAMPIITAGCLIGYGIVLLL